MNRLTMVRSLLVVALLAAIAASSGAGAQTATPPADHNAHHASTPIPTEPATMPGMDGTPSMGGMMQMGEFDLMFIDMMIVHHQGAVAMAEVALERGVHPEVITMAEEIIAAQEEEIAQLQAWRDAWYPDAPQMSMEEMMDGMGDMMSGMPGMGEMGGMMDPEAMREALRAAPEPFDLAFINAMIPHHLSALMMAEMAVQQATHPELAAAAQVMIDMQTDEIAQLRTWRAEWYGATATPAS